MMPNMIASLITAERVVPRLYARDCQEVINELARIAAAEVCLNYNMVRDAVLDRGLSSPFGYGRGIAIPHAAICGLAQPIGVFARCKPAQDFGAADDIPADLVFLLLSPDGDDPTHLRALACVARRLREREVAARLRSAQDVQAIYAVLTSDAWRAPEAEPEKKPIASRVSGHLSLRTERQHQSA